MQTQLGTKAHTEGSATRLLKYIRYSTDAKLSYVLYLDLDQANYLRVKYTSALRTGSARCVVLIQWSWPAATSATKSISVRKLAAPSGTRRCQVVARWEQSAFVLLFAGVLIPVCASASVRRVVMSLMTRKKKKHRAMGKHTVR